MIGKRGVVTEVCSPIGYVRIGAELWQADSLDGRALEGGSTVIVRRVAGLLVTVERTEDGGVTSPAPPPPA